MFEGIGNNPNYHQRITFQADEQRRGSKQKKDHVSKARPPPPPPHPFPPLPLSVPPPPPHPLPPLPLPLPIKGPCRLHVLSMIHEHYMHDHKVKLPTTKPS